MGLTASYPDAASARDAYVLSRRPARARHDPWRHQGLLVEDERAAGGAIVRSATIFLTGRECPWRCVMCDLWTHTIARDTPRGALVRQVLDARGTLSDPLPAQVKLYNAGSFFDPRAVPEPDYDALAGALRGFTHIVVESHPRLVGRRLRHWREALNRAAGEDPPATLEVAMGLETANPSALERLHKQFTLDDFARAADRILGEGAAIRVFLLVGVPFVPAAAQLEWVWRSAAHAFGRGASAVSLIPTRAGNGALEALAAEGLFAAPGLTDLECAMDLVLPDAAGRVFADIWDLERLAACRSCLEDRRDRLRAMNLGQHVLPRITSACCSPSEAL